ncbi:MAG: tetraacyldisaccharide 4'-kinase [Acidobacteriota bacterium]
MLPWRRPTRPVISVGNLAMGGRGKTPTVAAVAQLLVDAGERPAILSRGYGRRAPIDDVVVVSDGTHVLADLDRSGDEPLMLARQLAGAAVLVCDVRVTAAALAEERYNVTVHLLDDGFQHRSLKRDIDLVLVTPADLRDRRLPLGRLRSSPSALSRAHAVLVDGVGVEAVTTALDAVAPAARTSRYAIARHLGDPWMIEEGRPAISRETPVVAVAAIASPDRFKQALEAGGWRVTTMLAFRDHHAFTARDVSRMAQAVIDSGAQGVLTTEKDAMRLLPLRPLPVAVGAVPLRVSIEPAAEFGAWLLGTLRKVRARC